MGMMSGGDNITVFSVAMIITEQQTWSFVLLLSPES